MQEEGGVSDGEVEGEVFGEAGGEGLLSENAVS